jgi:hypothetical protein
MDEYIDDGKVLHHGSYTSPTQTKPQPMWLTSNERTEKKLCESFGYILIDVTPTRYVRGTIHDEVLLFRSDMCNQIGYGLTTKTKNKIIDLNAPEYDYLVKHNLR